MSTLTEQLAQTLKQNKKRIPETAQAVMQQAEKDLRNSGIEGSALADGEKAPQFSVKNHLNQERNLAAYLQQGPLVLSFYRGGW
ncbi:Alkyl hydroperoxide reductase/ Thiol specific antioxidant/ Mal allergen (fragment) [Pseudodesulfovibrio piezophilus]|uniref:Alkyl hydroperoxide reductase/ Thiol specific antioxidant/ Mal allergen n=1 Tax=Pseudodesulfovibrio piezophilus (strain DSM 21447 / JCM 15486 / C1TLV30) TaxID=1322246 RepID=M1WY48_PSEP2